MNNQHWKQLAKDKAITKEDVVALCLHKSIQYNDIWQADVLLKKSFTPITNAVKLTNGSHPNESLYLALRWVQNSSYLHQQPIDVQIQIKDLSTSFIGSYGVVKL